MDIVLLNKDPLRSWIIFKHVKVFQDKKDCSRQLQAPVVPIIPAIQIFPVEATDIMEQTQAIHAVLFLNSSPTKSMTIKEWWLSSVT